MRDKKIITYMCLLKRHAVLNRVRLALKLKASLEYKKNPACMMTSWTALLELPDLAKLEKLACDYQMLQGVAEAGP